MLQVLRKCRDRQSRGDRVTPCQESVFCILTLHTWLPLLMSTHGSKTAAVVPTITSASQQPRSKRRVGKGHMPVFKVTSLKLHTSLPRLRHGPEVTHKTTPSYKVVFILGSHES